MLSHALFVYGTLMSGEPRHHLLVSGGITVIEPATVAGILFHLGQYPGLHLSLDPSRRVQGEYIEFQGLGSRLLAVLDEEEGSEYSRKLVTVRRCNGTDAIAWIYVYKGTPALDRIIASGDWRLGLNKDDRSR